MSDSISKKEANIIRILRIIIFVVGIILLGFIAGWIVDDLIRDTLIPEIPFKSNDVKKTIAGLFIALTGYSLRRLLIDDIDDLIRYLGIKDLKEKIRVPGNTTENQVSGNGMVFKLLDLPRFTSYYLMILSIPVGLLAATELFGKESDQTIKPVYAFSLNDRSMAVDDLSSFKLYLTFENKVTTLEPNRDQAQIALLRNTILATSSCIQDKSDTIEYKIVGYASNPGTPNENIELAEKRSLYVQNLIQQIISKDDYLSAFKDNIIINSKEWELEDYDLMNRLKFDETSGETRGLGKSSSAEYYNRRAEIFIVRLGNCQ